MSEALLRLEDGASIDSMVRPALVGFWADWCVPSRELAADLESIAARFGERLGVALVDVDRSPVLRGRHAVRGLPTLVLLRAGREVLRRVGLVSREALGRLLEDALR